MDSYPLNGYYEVWRCARLVDTGLLTCLSGRDIRHPSTFISER